MSIYDVEGFDHYDDVSNLMQFRAIANYELIANKFSFVEGRSGGKALYMPTSGNNSSAGIVFPTSDSSELIFGFAYKFSQSTTRLGYTWYLNGSNAGYMQIRHNTSLNVDFWAVNATRGTANVILVPNVWYYLEFCIPIASSISKPAYIKVNGQQFDILPIGFNSSAYIGSKATSIVFSQDNSNNGAGRNIWLDDVYFADAESDMIGEFGVCTLYPNANGNQSDWLGSDGDSVDNYLLVDEVPADSGYYVSSSGVGEIDFWEFENLNVNAHAIHGISTRLSAYKVQPGSRGVAHMLRTNATDFEGSGMTVTATSGVYRVTQDIWLTNPDTASAWTQSDVDDLEIGVKLITL